MNGEAVCEIDIRASYLTILHARYSAPFKVSEDEDPYAIDGLPRSVVKAWRGMPCADSAESVDSIWRRRGGGGGPEAIRRTSGLG
jgi:hypothetical protein